MSFETFASTSLPGLLRFAGALTGDRRLAEDVVQEVLIRVQQRWESMAELADPPSYVRRMIVNEYLSWRRKWARIIPSSTIDDGRESPDPAVSITERSELAARLAQLPRRQRAVIVLRFYLDLSDDQIAAILGCSNATVRSHASRALAALRIDGFADQVPTTDRTTDAHR